MESIGGKGLKDLLNKVIRTLELSISLHNYEQLATTNMGLITQTLFHLTEQELHTKLSRWEYNDNYGKINYNDIPETHIKKGLLWNYLIRKYWSIDGKPTDLRYGLIHKLHRTGLTRNRIIELEYLKNKEVNAALKDYDWGFVEKDVFEEKIVDKLVPIMVTNEAEKWVPSTTLLGKLLGKKKRITEKSTFFSGKYNIVDDVQKTKIGVETVKTDKDFKNNKHVVIYYKKWVELIELKLKKETENKK